ncbi:hypothetical protein TWF730_000604 [Orbilia blumenaviensis]|uniref:C2H2-type domain-containing protein n=1 Tax=Orbilia blumenaviensis TaxID=1796055 RepID=A0AAV9VPA5_9PEZI
MADKEPQMSLENSEPSTTALKRPHEPEPWTTCTRCKEEFFTLDRAKCHFETLCSDLWCGECNVSFENPDHAQLHLSMHLRRTNLCPRCEFDVGIGGDLEKHWKETGCKLKCVVCDTWFYKESYEDHMIQSPYCRRGTFTTEPIQTPSTELSVYQAPQVTQLSGQLEPEATFEPQIFTTLATEIEGDAGRRLEQSHARKRSRRRSHMASNHAENQQIAIYGQANGAQTNDVQAQCYGCRKGYPHAGAMISHLEAGNCPSMIDVLDVNYTFATYSGSEALLVSDDRKSLGRMLNYENIRDQKVFRCRGNNCVASFSVLSALLQHIRAASGCSTSCGRQSLLNHMRVNLYYQSVVHRIKKMASSGPATMFVKPPPYRIDEGYLRLPEQWRLDAAKLRSYITIATNNIMCGKPDVEGRNFISFKDPFNMSRTLDAMGFLVKQLQEELGKLNAGSDRPGGGNTCQILMYFQSTQETHGLASFLRDVERFRAVAKNELQNFPARQHAFNTQVF